MIGYIGLKAERDDTDEVRPMRRVPGRLGDEELEGVGDGNCCCCGGETDENDGVVGVLGLAFTMLVTFALMRMGDDAGVSESCVLDRDEDGGERRWFCGDAAKISDMEEMLAWRIRIGVEEKTGSDVVAGIEVDAVGIWGRRVMMAMTTATPDTIEALVLERSRDTVDRAGDKRPLFVVLTASSCFVGDCERGVSAPLLVGLFICCWTMGFRARFVFALPLTCARGRGAEGLVAGEADTEDAIDGALRGETGLASVTCARGLPKSTFAITWRLMSTVQDTAAKDAYLALHLSVHGCRRRW